MRMIFSHTKLGVLALVIVSSSVASAADDKPYYGTVTVSRPNNEGTRNTFGETGFGLGFGYRLPSISMQLPVDSAAELDVARTSRSGAHSDSFGLSYVGRYNLAGAGKKGLYAGLGAGIQVAKLSTDAVSLGSGGQIPGMSESKTNFVGTVLVGYEVSANTFVEARYKFSPKVAGVETAALSLTVGIRF